MSDAASRLRRTLHAHPDLSGREAATARRIAAFFEPLAPDETVTGLGGYGLAFVFAGVAPGPTILLRCELDALPIHETGEAAHRSVTDGVAHLCGHDGHMAVLASVGVELSRNRPARGRVVLLFQPAEETGEGAAAVLGDERFAALKPDYAFALHNLPGEEPGAVVVRRGTFACASRGLCIRLTGTTAHAAQPNKGRSPAPAVSRLLAELPGLPGVVGDDGGLITVVGARLGDKAFGVAPGNAEIWATLRSETDADMMRLVEAADRLVADAAETAGLAWTTSWEDVFPATVNSKRAVQIVMLAAAPLGLLVRGRPFRWSEDFGRFTATCEGALFGVGAGEDTPGLHNPDYDFPDDLIAPAVGLLLRIVERCYEDLEKHR